MNPSNYLKIKTQIPSNVNILAVSKGFKSQEIKTIHNLGQNDFGESKYQEAFEKQLILKDLKQIKWHFIGRIQSNKIRKIVQNFKYVHSVDSFEKLQKISNISCEENKNPLKGEVVLILEGYNKKKEVDFKTLTSNIRDKLKKLSVRDTVNEIIIETKLPRKIIYSQTVKIKNGDLS